MPARWSSAYAWPGLKRLSLRGNAVPGSALPAFAANPRLASLAVLDLRGNDVKAADLGPLRAAFPTLRVLTDKGSATVLESATEREVAEAMLRDAFPGHLVRPDLIDALVAAFEPPDGGFVPGARNVYAGFCHVSGRWKLIICEPMCTEHARGVSVISRPSPR